MPAVTKSTDARLPRGDWPWTWRLVVLLSTLVLGTWELHWRQRGWDATVEANEESWILARGRLFPGSTVVAGTSRIQGVLDPDA